MRRLSILAFGLLVACGGSRASEPPPTVTPPPPPPTTATTTASTDCTGACEAPGQHCDQRPGWRCTCEEHADVNCGGAARELRPSWLAWSCTPIDPTTDRGDGCPFTAPADGAPCPSTSPRCRYASDSCGWSGTDAVCVGGTWSLQSFELPPPP